MNTDKMNEEMEEILKKHLPQQMGEVLKQRLEKADEDAESLKTHKGMLEAKNKKIEELNETIREYQAFDDRNSKLEKREKEVAEAERNITIKELEYKLANEKEKTTFAKEVSMGLVRNTEYRKNIFDNECHNGYYDGTGKWIDPRNVSKSYTEEKKTE